MSAQDHRGDEWYSTDWELAARWSGRSTRSDLDQVRVDALADDFGRRGPLTVAASSRLDVFCQLVGTAFVRQAQLLARATGASGGAGALAAQRWLAASVDLATSPGSVPAAARFLSSVLDQVTSDAPNRDWLADVTAAVLWAWRITIIPPNWAQAPAAPRPGAAGTAAAEASVELLDSAIDLEISHWHRGPRCGCIDSHAWIAPLMGWVEVLVADAATRPVVGGENH